MKEPVNPQIRRWLDEGSATDAIIGSDAHFVPSSTYVGEHDRILVLDQVFSWADAENQAADAARAIEEAVGRASENGDAPMAYDILWSYFVIADDRVTALPLNRERLLDSLTSLGRPGTVSAELADLVQDRVRRLPRSP